MGYLSDRDLNKEFGVNANRDPPGRDYLGGRENRDYEKALNLGREHPSHEEGRTGKDYLGLGNRLNYNAMRGFYDGPLSGGVDSQGHRYDGRNLGAGCGPEDLDRFIPDRVGSVDLQDACDAHDVCYADGEQSRMECDGAFGMEVYRDCLTAGYGSTACTALSIIYYESVRVGGRRNYRGDRNY